MVRSSVSRVLSSLGVWRMGGASASARLTLERAQSRSHSGKVADDGQGGKDEGWVEGPTSAGYPV